MSANEESKTELKETRRTVEAYFAVYRTFKYEKFQRREPKITNLYEPRYHGRTGKTSDPTAQIAIWNVFTEFQRLQYCERVERVVDRLPVKELRIMRLRYMQRNCPLDLQVARQSGISKTTYSSRRDIAFAKLNEELKGIYESVARIVDGE